MNACAPCAVRKSAFLYRPRNGHVPLSKKPASKRMPSHEEKQKNHHPQAEIVVIGDSDNTLQWLSLQFRRRKRLNTYLAKEPSCCVMIWKLSQSIKRTVGVLSHQDAPIIHISDDATNFLNDSKTPAVFAAARMRRRQSTC